ncbi:hypothetical protein HRI_005019200 [Hibiscus trionum]|nr:hypothetical protein HRI_005019200 [Hibiscus trionum]
MGRVNGVTRPESQALQLACLSSPSPSTDTHFSTAPWPGLVLPKTKDTLLLCPTKDNSPKNPHPHNLELQLLTTTKPSEVQSTVQAPQQLRLAMEEKAYAEEARQEAKRQIEIAEQEFAKAKRIRQQAQAELEKAQALKDHAIRQINSTFLEITCHACRQKFQARRTLPEENSLVGSYISSAITEGEVDNEIQTNITKATKH